MVEHADLTPNSSYGMVKIQKSKTQKLTVIDQQEKLDAEQLVLGVFKKWSEYYRKTQPKLYKKIDRILSNPNRIIHKEQAHIKLVYTGPVRDCLRCGKDFPSIYPHQGRFCCEECREEHRDWCKRTGRPFYSKQSQGS